MKTASASALSSALCFSSASELARGIREREFSAEEVVRLHLQRIDVLNPCLNGLLAVASEAALEQARAADHTLAQGEPVGPLHGVPFTVKDVYAVGETSSLRRAPGISGKLALIEGPESSVIRRLRSAGAILLGVSRATLWRDREEAYGPAHNPYDLARSPGGSSGGEAVTIAAGCSPLGWGSDSGGSLRQPAHFCGLASLRPSNGRVPCATDAGANDPRTVAGPLARSIRDVALALDIVSGLDPLDPTTLPLPRCNPRDIVVEGLRIAVHTSHALAPATAETAACVVRAAAALASAGAVVEQQPPPDLDQAWQLTLDYWAHCREEGTLSDYLRFQERWQRYRLALHAWMQRWDLILCPVEAFPAAPAAAGTLQPFTYTAPYSLLGWPSAVVRAGTSEQGLPIGVQLIGRAHRDDVALAGAASVEAALGGFHPPPLS